MPNWRKQSDYAFTESLERTGWAWEFLWATQAATQAEVITLPGLESISDGSSIDGEYLSRHYGARWGQQGAIADPARDEPPDFYVFPISPTAEQVGAFFVQSAQQNAPEQHPDFVTLTFDLRDSVPKQIKQAKIMLRTQQHGKSVRKAVHKGEDQWPLYLRVLDALEDDAPPDEVISKIKAYANLNKIAAQKLRDKHEDRAIELRDDPLRLIR